MRNQKKKNLNARLILYFDNVLLYQKYIYGICFNHSPIWELKDVGGCLTDGINELDILLV